MRAHLRCIIQCMRLPFVLLALSSVFVGYSCLSYSALTPAPWELGLVVCAAVLAQLSVNTLNEYLDFKSGLDLLTSKTPFSGGSGGLPQYPAAANSIFAVAITSLLLTICIGIYFVYQTGWPLVLLGLLGVGIIMSYTQWLNRQAWLCLIAPGLAFGPLMVIGTPLALANHISTHSMLASVVVFFLSNNLLLLNQIPDTPADQQIGRRHFPIVYGKQHSLTIYVLFALAVGCCILAGISTQVFPTLSLLALLPLVLVLPIYLGVKYAGQDTQSLTPYLGLNIFQALLTPLLLGFSLLLSE